MLIEFHFLIFTKQHRFYTKLGLLYKNKNKKLKKDCLGKFFVHLTY